MAGKGSLRVISKSLNFEESTANIGIGGSFAPNVKLTIINNPNSWKNTIFKNSQNSDYISIGNYDSNNNNNNYIASIDKNIDLFKDLYINNLGISSQPSSLIGNVIINGKTTIGNSSNDITNNHILDIYSKTSNNLLILRNSNTFLDFSVNNNNFNINTSSSLIIGSSNISNSLNSKLFISGNAIIDNNLIIGSNNSNLNNLNKNNYYSILINSNMYINCNLDVNGLISGFIKTSSIILDETKKINANLININSNSPLFITSSNQLSFNINSNSPLFITSSNQLSFKINSNSSLFIDSNNELSTINQTIYNINSNSPLYVDSNNQLSFNINPEIFYITPYNELSILDTINIGGGGGNTETYWKSANPNISPSDVIYFNYGKSYVAINNDDPRSYLYVGPNGNLLRLATINDVNDSYYSQISTNDNVNNSNNTKIKLIAPVSQQLLNQTSDISGSIYYNITGNNPIHSFNYDSNGIITSQLFINKSGLVTINSSNNYQTSNNEKLIVNGSISIIDENSNKFIIGSNVITNNYSIFNGTVDIISSNSKLTIGSNIFTNNSININQGNVNINSNLFINGLIYANGSNISNLKISQLYLDDINKKLNANFINIDSNTGININDSNQLYLKLDYSKFEFTSNNEISLINSAIPSYWNSAIPLITDPSIVSKIYFNKSESYIGINNDDPRSYLYVGPNGNLLRLATINDINESYYSQISTNDNVNNSNNTKIKLIAPVDQSLLLSSNNDISGSIYYNITGNNPIHSFNYENNGIITPQLFINKSGVVTINSSNNYQTSNNEKLIVNGSISIIDANSNKLIIGSNVISNNYSIFNGTVDIISSNSKLTIGSNIFTNNSININEGNVNINSNLYINGLIYANGSNISNLKVSELYLDDINRKLNGNFINIDSNTGIDVNQNNQLYLKLDYNKFEFTSNNEISLTNSAVPSFWNSAIPLVTDPTIVSKIYFNKSESFVGINNDDPRSYLYVGPNGNLLRLATINDINESYYSQISTNDNVNNNNNTKIKLIAPVDQSLLVSSNNDISGSIYYNITGNNPIHSFNYENNGIITPQLFINKSGIVTINSSNNYQTSNNEKLIVNGSISIIDANSNKLIIGSNVISNNQVNFNSKTLIGSSNYESSLYALYINEGNVKINSNLYIGSNIISSNQVNFKSKTLIGSSNYESSLYSLYINESNVKINSNLYINGLIYANGSNISNLKVSQLYLDDNTKKINGNFINIDSNTGINVNTNSQLYLKLDTSKFQITSNNEISLSNSAVPSFWKSAVPFITDPTTVSKIYFNYNDSFVGINNDDPRSYLYVGPNGNLLRLATINNITESYYSQISTNDNVNNNNNTKIKLIAPVDQSLLVSSNNDISGSIYYNITGSNPLHSFNYDSNGNVKSLMSINKNGLITINSSNIIASNNEKLIVNGNVSILNSPKVIIGDSNYNNGILQTYGNIIIGNSNIDTNQYSLYINSNVKINNDLVINSNLVGSNIVNFTKYVSIGSYIQQNDNNYVLNVNGNMALNGIINTTSDIRLKNNIKTCENSLDKILKCRGVSFNYNKDDNKNIGVIAQELEEIFPELVNTNNEGYKNVNYLGIIGVLIEAIKDLNNKIEK